MNNHDNFKRYLSFSRSERIAIIAIVSMIVIALVIKYLLIQIILRKSNTNAYNNKCN